MRSPTLIKELLSKQRSCPKSDHTPDFTAWHLYYIDHACAYTLSWQSQSLQNVLIIVFLQL